MRNETALKELLGDDPPVLIDEKRMGMLVQISHHPDEDVIILECQNGPNYQIAEVPRDKVMDAFNHPALYVADPSALFPKSKSL